MERSLLIGLVTRAQKGDSAAMEELFAAFYNDVYYFALKTVKDSDTACDITQETFLEIIRTIGNLQEPAAFVTWMKQITYHQCTHYFKKKKDVLVEEDEEGNSIFDTLADESEGAIPAEVYEKAEFRETILGMINELTEEQRSAVMLYYFDELTVGQIAQIQGVSEGTVKSRLNYARKAIKKSVESYEKKHDIKLHSFSILPLLLLFFGKEAMPAQKAAEVQEVVAKAAGAAVAAESVGGAAVAASAKGAVTSAGTGLFAKIAALPLVTKIIAGVAALAIVAGGAFAVLGGTEHDCRDRDDDSLCDVCEKTMHSKKPNHTKPGTDGSSESDGDTEPSEPESTGGAELSGPQYRSESLFVYEMSYLVHGNIQKIHCFNQVYVETNDGMVYAINRYDPSITIEGSDFFCFYDCYGYTGSDGKLYIGKSWQEPRFTAEGVTGQILYCCIPEMMGMENAFVFTLEENGELYRTEISAEGIVRKVPVVLKTSDQTSVDENGDPIVTIWDTFADVQCLSGDRLGISVDLPGRLAMLYVRTPQNALLSANLVYGILGEAEEVLTVDASLCDDLPNSDYQLLAFSIGTVTYAPLHAYTPQDTTVYCGSWYDTVSAFDLPAGYTVANIVQAYSGNNIVLIFDDGNIYCAKNAHPDNITQFVLDEELSALNRDGHILSLIDAREAFLFLADDGYIYSKTI